MVSTRSPEEVLGRLDTRERERVERFRDAVRNDFGSRVRDLRIFGSKVRGDAHPESDIDLLVLIDDYDAETGSSIVRLAHEISPWLAPVVRDYDHHHSPASRATGFYEELRRESVRL